MATKPSKRQLKTERLVVVVTHDLKAGVHKQADREDRSVGSIIRAALEAYLSR